MNYRDMENGAPKPIDGQSLSTHIENSRNALYEATMMLTEIISRVTSQGTNEDKRPEPSCLMDAVEMVDFYADGVAKLAARLHKLMF